MSDSGNEWDLQKFQRERDNVIINMFNDPPRFAATMYQQITKRLGFGDKETFSPYLHTNEQSLCCLVGKTSVDLEKQPKICAFAKVEKISPSADLTTNKNETYEVTSPNRQTYVIKSREIPNLFVKYEEHPSATLKEIQGQQKEMDMCLYRDINIMKFMASDSFTNETLIGFVLDVIYQQHGHQHGLHGYIKNYSATICNQGRRQYGINFMEYADMGNLIQFVHNPESASYLQPLLIQTDDSSQPFRIQTLTKPSIIDIFKQIVSNLVFVQENAQFNHGDLKPSNILIVSEPTEINYKGLVHKSALSFKLSDYEKSSLTVNLSHGKVRLYSSTITSDLYFAAAGFTPHIKTKFNESYYQVEKYISIRLLAQLRHMGIPFYHSWDTYTFLISVLIMPEVFYQVFTDVQLKSAIWDPMWFPDDSSTIFLRLQKAVQQRKNPNYDTILDILKGAKLKCRGTSLLFTGISTL